MPLPANWTLRPSLRANGSRECAPDDRLREAIHRAAKKVWIASAFAKASADKTSQAILAKKVDTVLRSRDVLRPSFARNFLAPFKSEGAGNAGCALHPRSHAQCAQEVRARAYRAAESIRHSLRNGFTAYNGLSLVP